MLISVILLFVLFLPYFCILHSFICQSLKKIRTVSMSFIGQMVLDWKLSTMITSMKISTMGKWKL